ncbi:methyltransferase domain-containing protein [Mycolicibacterium neoaurum]|uniref:class I SAM-dependent methyltransferase n=1 Tax=Mycolicibacterium neoaurum TaxID=1795 RepID=UPI0026734D4B|nr:class I SAM-dependent methyltransferase [Mycolicibacterium neoaurum]MDO3401376.1 methyltransferase domain-containing protein [Mycolicibacterium neoaurum]
MDETWNSIADWYTELVRDGSPMHQFARDILLAVLPDSLAGLTVLDIGCGEGLITRALAARGGTATGIDPTRALIAHAHRAERDEPVGAQYRVDDATTLSTVADASVDWATAGLSLNNVADLPAALAALIRVLKPAGRLVFTVPHPCFDAPRSTAVIIDGALRRIVGDYMDQGFWRTTAPQSVHRVGNHHRTIGTYVNALIDNGFQITSLAEPVPDELVRQGNPHRVGLPPFLLICAINLEPERIPN